MGMTMTEKILAKHAHRDSVTSPSRLLGKNEVQFRVVPRSKFAPICKLAGRGFYFWYILDCIK